MTLALCPIDFPSACEFVRKHHRHHRPPTGHKFSIAVADGDKIVGVAMVGRPVSRILDNGWTLEINRIATDGTHNACSVLLGACRRAAWALGYRKLITYTLPSEGGTSLRAAGYRCVGEAGGGEWKHVAPRANDHPLEAKWRWEVTA